MLLTESISVNHLEIGSGGLLVFKDTGRSLNSILQKIQLRAKSIHIMGGADFAQLWIGSRSCRYLGSAEISLYGNSTEMEESWIGKKFLHADYKSVLELHGKEKKSWTNLAEHVFKDNIPYHPTVMDSDKGTVGSGIHIHRYNSEGDIKDVNSINTLQVGFDQVTEYIQGENFEDDILVLFSSG